MNPAKVTAVVVTRGDVNMTPILDSLHAAGLGEILVYDNSGRPDVAVYGRYIAATEARFPVVLVQDDDVILPAASIHALLAAYAPGKVTCNMPERFRHDFYEHHALVGFGAVFDRELPGLAFWKFGMHSKIERGDDAGGLHRTCDVIFTSLTPRVLVDVPYSDREFASDPSRMWRQPTHVGERTRTLTAALKIAA